jgi:hypothetical protein
MRQVDLALKEAIACLAIFNYVRPLKSSEEIGKFLTCPSTPVYVYKREMTAG